MHLDRFLKIIKDVLPEICTDRDLVSHLPNFFKNPSAITRLRAQGLCPPYFHVPPHVHYLRDDVLAWLRQRYQDQDEAIPQAKRKTLPSSSKKQASTGRFRGARK